MGEPIFEIIEETEELNEKELQLPGGEALRGLNAPRCKFTEKDIREVMDLFINTTLTYKEIESITALSYSAVMDLCKGRSHEWIQKEYTEEQKIAARHIRNPSKVLYSPDGIRYEAQTLKEINALAGTNLSYSVFNSNRGYHESGYSIYPPSKYRITCPDGEVLEVFEHYARQFFKASELSKYEMLTIFQKGKIAKGYRCEKISL